MNKRILLILGGAMFGALLVLSVVFFKERTAFIDIAYHLFFILAIPHATKGLRI